MATVTRKGITIHLSGELPDVGDLAPDFLLTTGELRDVSLDSFRGKKKVLNIVPSLDTGVCAASAIQFNERSKELPDTVFLTISNDLPYAQNRFREAEHIDNLQTLSQLRNRDFGTRYGVEMKDGPQAGLLARAVIVLDSKDRVVYTQLVPDIGNEPDYDAALNAVRQTA